LPERAIVAGMAQAFHWPMKNPALRNIPDGGFDFILP